mmetsp:Transcript_27926/g.71362  ORF Transcript_27926/g.71362 Transcript_27926/m.71362 type:complete len:235 (-) Transcript_27926:36-740(-)
MLPRAYRTRRERAQREGSCRAGIDRGFIGRRLEGAKEVPDRLSQPAQEAAALFLAGRCRLGRLFEVLRVCGRCRRCGLADGLNLAHRHLASGLAAVSSLDVGGCLRLFDQLRVDLCLILRKSERYCAAGLSARWHCDYHFFGQARDSKLEFASRLRSGRNLELVCLLLTGWRAGGRRSHRRRWLLSRRRSRLERGGALAVLADLDDGRRLLFRERKELLGSHAHFAPSTARPRY